VSEMYRQSVRRLFDGPPPRPQARPLLHLPASGWVHRWQTPSLSFLVPGPLFSLKGPAPPPHGPSQRASRREFFSLNFFLFSAQVFLFFCAVPFCPCGGSPFITFAVLPSGDPICLIGVAPPVFDRRCFCAGVTILTTLVF